MFLLVDRSGHLVPVDEAEDGWDDGEDGEGEGHHPHGDPTHAEGHTTTAPLQTGHFQSGDPDKRRKW